MVRKYHAETKNVKSIVINNLLNENINGSASNLMVINI